MRLLADKERIFEVLKKITRACEEYHFGFDFRVYTLRQWMYSRILLSRLRHIYHTTYICLA